MHKMQPGWPDCCVVSSIAKIIGQHEFQLCLSAKCSSTTTISATRETLMQDTDIVYCHTYVHMSRDQGYSHQACLSSLFAETHADNAQIDAHASFRATVPIHVVASFGFCAHSDSFGS